MVKKSNESLVMTNGQSGVELWTTGAHVQEWVNLIIQASNKDIKVKTDKL